MAEPNVPATSIDLAPDEDPAANAILGAGPITTEMVFEAYNRLQTQNESLVAELNRMEGSSEAARAKLIQPYAWAVFRFLCGYCAAVGGLLLLDGFHPGGFHLGDAVLSIAVGSTAASAIWLVRIIVQGLFPDLSARAKSE